MDGSSGNLDDLLGEVAKITGDQSLLSKTSGRMPAPAPTNTAPTGANSRVRAVHNAAAKLGIDPLDYATAMSYETAGTFDPWQPGPVTKWGQHRGTIQYGEPQRREFGVYEGQSFEDQVENSNVKYLQAKGVKPGDDLLAIYKAINGGSVNASANASDRKDKTGRPITIADHVREMMGEHRRNAQKFLGAEDAPPISGLEDLLAEVNKINGNAPGTSAPANKTASGLEDLLAAANEITNSSASSPAAPPPVLPADNAVNPAQNPRPQFTPAGTVPNDFAPQTGVPVRGQLSSQAISAENQQPGIMPPVKQPEPVQFMQSVAPPNPNSDPFTQEQHRAVEFLRKRNNIGGAGEDAVAINNADGKTLYLSNDQSGLKPDQARFIGANGQETILLKKSKDGIESYFTQTAPPAIKRFGSGAMKRAGLKMPPPAPKTQLGEARILDDAEAAMPADGNQADKTALAETIKIPSLASQQGGLTAGSKFVPDDQLEDLYRGKVSETLLNNYAIPKSDTGAFLKEKGFKDLATGTAKTDFSRIKSDDDTINLTRGDVDNVREYSAQRREQLKGEALQKMASEQEFSDEDKKYFRDNDLDLDALIGTTEAASAANVGFAKQKEVKRVESAYKNQGDSPFLARVKALRDVVPANQKYAQLATDEQQAIEEIREEKRRELSSQINSQITGTGAGMAKAGGMEPITPQQIETGITDYQNSIIKKYGSASAALETRKQEALAAEQEANSRAADDVSILGKVREVERNFIRPLPKMVADLEKTAGIVQSAISRLGIPNATVFDVINSFRDNTPLDLFAPAEKRAIYQIGENYNKFLEKDLPRDPRLRSSFLLTVVPDTLGQITSQIALGAATGGSALPMASGLAQGATAQYDEAKRGGATEKQRLTAAFVGALAASPDALLINKWLRFLPKGEGGTFLNRFAGSVFAKFAEKYGAEEAKELTKLTLRGAAKNIAFGSVFEAGQETVEQTINDTVERLTWNPEKKPQIFNPMDAAGGAIGGVAGGGFETVSEYSHGIGREDAQGELDNEIASASQPESGTNRLGTVYESGAKIPDLAANEAVVNVKNVGSVVINTDLAKAKGLTSATKIRQFIEENGVAALSSEVPSKPENVPSQAVEPPRQEPESAAVTVNKSSDLAKSPTDSEAESFTPKVPSLVDNVPSPVDKQERAAAPDKASEKVDKLSSEEAPKPPREFSSTQVNFPKEVADQVLSLGKTLIKDEDLAEDGREDKPHITAKFGLETDNPDDVRKLLADVAPFTVTLGKTSIFDSNPDFDVVKIDVVDSPELAAVNKLIGDNLKNGDVHPTYKPHVTLAYVKKGTGKKYLGDNSLEGTRINFSEIYFSDKNRNQIPIPLGGKTGLQSNKQTQKNQAVDANQTVDAGLQSNETFNPKPVRPQIESKPRIGGVSVPASQSREILGTDFEVDSDPAAPEVSAPIVKSENAKPETAKPETARVIKQKDDTADTEAQKTVYTERGTKAAFTGRVIAAADLLTSLDEGYPPEFQPRNRTRAASKAQIEEIANNLNPELLDDSVKASDGRPLVVPVELKGKTRYAVISGNGRVEAIRVAYRNGKSNDYQSFTKRKDAAAKVAEPVYVGVLDAAELNLADFAKEANEQSTARMSATETAMSDGERLTPDLLAQFEPNEYGDITNSANQSFVKGFISRIASTERGEMMDAAGRLSTAGAVRIKNAVFAAAYGNADSLARIAESTDNNVRNISNAMLRVAGKVAALKAAVKKGVRYPLDISESLSAALNKLSALRSEGMSVEDYLNQGALFGGDLAPLDQRILQIFDANKRSSQAVATILDNYLRGAEEAGNPQQNGFFGSETVEPEELLEGAINEYARNGNYGQSNLFGQEAEKLPTRPAQSSGVSESDPSEQAQGENQAKQRDAIGAGALRAALPPQTPEELSPEMDAKLDELLERYRNQLGELNAAIEDIGAAVGLSAESIQTLDAVKKKPRIVEKILADQRDRKLSAPDITSVKDIVRASLIVESIAQLQSAADRINAGLPIVRAKDRFSEPTDVGYADVLLNVDLGNGLIGEVQLHVQEMIDAKKQAHQYYDITREFDDSGLERSAAEEAQYREAKNRQAEIYAEARAAFTRRTNLDFSTLKPSIVVSKVENSGGSESNLTFAPPPFDSDKRATGTSATEINSGSEASSSETVSPVGRATVNGDLKSSAKKESADPVESNIEDDSSTSNIAPETADDNESDDAALRQSMPIKAKSLAAVYNAPLARIARKATAVADKYRIEGNAELGELIRRLEQQKEIERVGLGKAEAVGFIAGVMLEPAQARDYVKRLNKLADAASAKNLKEEAANLRLVATAFETAAKFSKAGEVLPYILDESLPHEEFHRAGFAAAIIKVLSERHAQLDRLFNLPAAKKAWTNLLSKNGTANNKALIVEETAAWIADGRLEDLGIDADEAADFLELFFRSFAQKQIALSGGKISITEALADFQNPALERHVREMVTYVIETSAAAETSAELKTNEKQSGKPADAIEPAAAETVEPSVRGANGAEFAGDGARLPNESEPQSEGSAESDNRRESEIAEPDQVAEKPSSPISENQNEAPPERKQRVAAFSRILGSDFLYDVQSHEQTVSKAAQLVADKGVSAAVRDAIDSNAPSAASMAVLYHELERLNGLADYHLENGNKAEFDVFAAEIAGLSNAIVQKQVRLGQAIEISKILAPMSPEVAALTATRMKRFAEKDESVQLRPDELKPVAAISGRQKKLRQKLAAAREELAKANRKIKRLEGDTEQTKENQPRALLQDRLLKEYQNKRSVILSDLKKAFPNSPLFNGESMALRMALTANGETSENSATDNRTENVLDDATRQALIDFSVLSVLQGQSYSDVVETLIDLTGFDRETESENEQLQQIHSDAMAVIKPSPPPISADARARIKIRQEHYLNAGRFENRFASAQAKMLAEYKKRLANEKREAEKQLKDLDRKIERAALEDEKLLDRARQQMVAEAKKQLAEEKLEAEKQLTALDRKIEQAIQDQEKELARTAKEQEKLVAGYEKSNAAPAPKEIVLSGLAQDALADERYNSNWQMIAAIDRLSNDKTNTITAVIRDLQTQFPDLNVEQAKTLAGKAQYAVADLRAARRRALDEAKQISAEQREIIDQATIEQARATSDLNKLFARLAHPPGLIKRFNNDTRAKFVNNWATQTFNVVQAAVVSMPVETIFLDVLEAGMRAAGINFAGNRNEAPRLRDLLLPYGYLFANNRRLAESVIAQFPEEYFRVMNGLMGGDVELNKIPIAAGKTGLSKLGHRWFDWQDNINDKLSAISGAQLQEFHFRGAIINGAIDQIIRRKTKGGETLESVVKTGTLLDYIDEAGVKLAVDKAMRVTYASEISDPVGQALKRGYDFLDDYVPVLINPVTYARFTYTVAREMTINPLLFGALDAKAAGGAGYTPRSIAKGVLGYAGVAASYALMSAFGGDDDDWETLYVFGKDQPPLNIKRFFPVSAYFYTAHLLKNVVEGRPAPTPKELLEGFASLETDFYERGAGMQLATAAYNIPFGDKDIEGKLADLGKASARQLGSYLSGYLSFAKPFKQLFAQIDKDQAKVRDYGDGALDQFMKEVNRTIPFTDRAYNAPTKRDPVTDEEIVQPLPMGRMFGITLIHPSFTSPRETAATEVSKQLFKSNFVGDEMSEKDRKAYFVRRELKDAVRGGKVKPQDLMEKINAYMRDGTLTEKSADRLRDDLQLSDLQVSLKYGFNAGEEGEIKNLRSVWGKATESEKEDIRDILREKEDVPLEVQTEFRLSEVTKKVK